MISDSLTIALPKGKLGEESLQVLEAAGLPTGKINPNGRKLVIEYPKEGLKFILCRPFDIPTYVEYGASDLGIVGKDVIEETKRNIFELVDLGFGRCRFVIAVPRKNLERYAPEGGPPAHVLGLFPQLRVATKFPAVALRHFQSLGLQAEIIFLHGNIELAPQVGLAEAIVDIVSTGKTLKENDLVAIDELFEASARLVANRVSYRLKYQRIQRLVDAAKQVAEGEHA